MKKVGIITIHVGNNFGSILQTIATHDTVERLGYFPIIIDYIPSRVTTKRYIKGAFISPHKLIWRAIFLPIYLKNKHIYRSFLSKYVNLSHPIYHSQKFDSACPKADIYMTGSDQVWNSIHNEGFDSHYYFEGVHEGIKRFSFSSSFGRTDIDEQESIKIKELLSKYQAISVREDSAVEFLKKLGIQSTQHLDPTFLLDKNEWNKYKNPRIEQDPYILIYTPYNTVNKEIIYNSARYLAQKYNKKIVTFSWDLKKESKADRTIFFANPGDFLSLMYHADFVITNSFHGSAFSINLNKQFWVFQPSAFSTRIESILNLTGLKERMLTTAIMEDDITTIDYVAVNKILDEERKRSIDFLSNNLK